jgi:hypothetical protein
MQAPTTAERPVLSQRVELRSATSSSYFADLCALSLQRILRQEWQEWIVIDAKLESTPVATDPFAAVAHEHRITNRPAVVREEDSAIKSLLAMTMAERYHGSRNRLLAFKKAR